MSDTILFPTVKLESFNRGHKGGHAQFSSTFPKAVGDAMGWNGIPDGVTSAKLEGNLAATHVVLKPKDGPLSKWELGFDATQVGGFEVFRLELEGHKGKGHRIELRFKVAFADKQACRYLEEYITNAGEAKASLIVSYVQQTKMDLQPGDQQNDLAGDERRKATAAESD